MPHTVCTQTGTNADLQREPSQLVQRSVFDQTHGAFLSKSKALHEELGLRIEMQPIQTPVSTPGEGFYYTSQSLSTVLAFSLGMSTAARFCLFLCPFVSPQCVTASLCLRGTCTRRWTPPSSSGPISHSQSKCKCPVGDRRVIKKHEHKFFFLKIRKS